MRRRLGAEEASVWSRNCDTEREALQWWQKLG